MAPRYQAPRLWLRKRWSYSRRVQTSVWSGNEKPAGATPTIVYGSRLSWTVWPTTAGSPANRARQRRMAEDGDLGVPGLVLAVLERAPECGTDAQRVEERRADVRAFQARGLAAPGQGDSVASKTASDSNERAPASTSRKFCGE